MYMYIVYLIVNDIDVSLVSCQIDGENPTCPLEQEVVAFLLIGQLCGDVEHVLLTTQWTVTIFCREKAHIYI